MLVGYMRVSTESNRQVLDLQRDALLAAGVDERHLFEDRASGSRTAAPAWERRLPSPALAIAWWSGSWIGSADPCHIC
jgi:hypothetical protein